MPPSAAKRPQGSTALLFVLAACAAAPVACSQIIGADKKRDRAEDDAGHATDAFVSATAVPTGTGTGPPPCASHEKRCEGACVEKSDPIYGCTETGCDRCSVPYAATLKCENGKCAPATCQTGRQDCNKKPEDGCEADLNDAKTCGECTKACPAGAPNCNPLGQCVLDCTPFTLCGTSCVDLTNNSAHCSQCNKTCPTIGANSVPTCKASSCTIACNEGYADCDSNTTTDCVQKKPYYADGDNDGYAALTAVSAGEACAAPAGHSLLRTDCDDTNPAVKPGQEGYFATGYTKAAGGTSYDYDCNGLETPPAGRVIGACAGSACAVGYVPAPPRPGAQNVYCGSTEAVGFCPSSSSISTTSCSTMSTSTFSCR